MTPEFVVLLEYTLCTYLREKEEEAKQTTKTTKTTIMNKRNRSNYSGSLSFSIRFNLLRTLEEKNSIVSRFSIVFAYIALTQ